MSKHQPCTDDMTALPTGPSPTLSVMVEAIAGGVVAVLVIVILVLTVVVIMLTLRLRKRSNKNGGAIKGETIYTVHI